jgi:hypothetical protein
VRKGGLEPPLDCSNKLLRVGDIEDTPDQANVYRPDLVHVGSRACAQLTIFRTYSHTVFGQRAIGS